MNKNTKLATVVTETTDKTPIEIALGIDENGMTTASRLYAFLELDPTHFSRWCKKNIVNNKFATENSDYIPLAIEGERYNPNPKTDYKLTAEFAKKLSMTGNTERHEEARKYFIACEQGLKVAVQKLNSQIDYTQIAQLISDSITASLNPICQSIATMQQEISDLKETNTNRYLRAKKYPSAWYKKMAPKYKMLEDYFNCTRRELYHNIYKDLEDTYDVDIAQIHEDYCYENHLLEDECYPMDAIEHHSKLRDAVTVLIDGILIKFGLQTEEQIKHFKRETIFDRKPISLENIVLDDNNVA